MHMMMLGSRPFGGVAPDHAAALLGPLLAPLLIWVSLRLAGRAATAGWGIAQRFQLGYDCASGSQRRLAILLVLAGTVHLLLIPVHLAEAPATALLFCLNGTAFLALSAGAFLWTHWRPAAGLLLAVTRLGYAWYLAIGQEDLDTVGVATYLLELTVLGLVWLPGPANRPPRRQRKVLPLNAATLPVRS